MGAMRALCGAILASAAVAVATLLSFWAAGRLHLRDPVDELAVLVWPIFLALGIVGAAPVGALATLMRSVRAGVLWGAAVFATVPLLIVIATSMLGGPVPRIVLLAINVVACASVGALAGGSGAAVRAREPQTSAVGYAVLRRAVGLAGAGLLTATLLVALSWAARLVKDTLDPDPVPYSLRGFFPRVELEDASIRSLDIMRRRGQFQDSNMVWVGTLASLESLTLSHTALTDHGAAHLAGLARLRELYLDYTKVTDAALVYLSGLKELRRLGLRGTLVSDAGMANLAPLVQLEFLDIAETAVGDQGLKAIGTLNRLEYLDVSRSRVTANGIRELKNRLPKARIIWEPAAAGGTTSDERQQRARYRPPVKKCVQILSG